MQNGAEKRLGRPESRSESRKTPETEHQRVLQDDASRKSSIASVVKDRASERARAHILSILREAIHKMELENRSHLLKSTGDDYESERRQLNWSMHLLEGRLYAPALHSHLIKGRNRNRCNNEVDVHRKALFKPLFLPVQR